MFHHISIAVNHPLHVANVLAEVLSGRCFSFPPHAGSYIVIVDDGFGTGIELYPADTQLTPEPEQVGFASGTAQPFTSVHAAVSIAVSQAQITQIAAREGWLVRLCDRGAFHVIEFWVENKFMLELLTPDMAKEYLQFAHAAGYEAFLRQATPQLVKA